MSQVSALTSWMWTFGSSTMRGEVVRRVAGGQAARCPSGTAGRPGAVAGPAPRAARIRSVTSTRASIADRAVTIVAQPPCSRPALAPRAPGSPRRTSPAAARRGTARERDHPAGRVVLGQPVGRDHVRVASARLVGAGLYGFSRRSKLLARAGSRAARRAGCSNGDSCGS